MDFVGKSTAMFRIARHPSMVVPIAVVIVVPIPFASLDYAGGCSESNEG
jgi:hypothetical protein